MNDRKSSSKHSKSPRKRSRMESEIKKISQNVINKTEHQTIENSEDSDKTPPEIDIKKKKSLLAKCCLLCCDIKIFI